MRDTKLYDTLFPFWVIFLLPHVLLLSLIGNFAIDSVVLVIVYYVICAKRYRVLGEWYKRSIWKVWSLGLLADLAGGFFMALCERVLSSDTRHALDTNLYENGAAVLVSIAGMLIASLLIYLFNARTEEEDDEVASMGDAAYAVGQN